MNAAQLLADNGPLALFMPKDEREALRENLNGEEGKYFEEMAEQLAIKINNAPLTGDQDSLGLDAVIHFHYFRGSYDAWITELDRGDGSSDKRQHQAFGFCSFGGPHDQDAEFGYVSIQELIENNVELDLYWTPITVAELRSSKLE